MQMSWSEIQARVGHRMAMHLRIESVLLPNQMATVSFTFDDAPKSAATVGAAILESYDAKGTFYVSGGLVGTTWSGLTNANGDEIIDLHARGHEIGCHTFSHTRACDLDARLLSDEIEQNRAYFQALCPNLKLENFAYPFGNGSFMRKRQLRGAFKSCRSVMPGVNKGALDLQFLRATPLIDRLIDRDGIDRAFDAAEKNRGWLIFYSHDVADEPSPYGCSPGLLNHALESAAQRNVSVLNIAQTLLMHERLNPYADW